MRKTKTQKGITLIALIITIIVLLILAVVAIGAVQNDGIIDHAKNARDQYSTAQTNENSTIQAYLDKIKEHVGTGSGAATGTGGNSTVSRFYIFEEGESRLEVDGTIRLVVREDKGTPEITEVEWTSSNSEVATVDDNGVVTGVNASKGTTIIKATSTKDNKVSATIQIVVHPKEIGDCENEKCNNGWVVLGRKCPICGAINTNVKSESDEAGDTWFFEDCGHSSGQDGENAEADCEYCESGKIYDYGN